MTMHALDGEQTLAAVSISDAIGAVRAGFVSLAAGELEMPQRTAFDQGAYLVMAARHAPTRSLMTKILSLNFEGRSPAIVGSVVYTTLDSVDQVVLDAGAVTALRTGAASGVATDLLAPAGASSCAMVGAGAQAAFQVRAMHAVRPLSQLTVADTDRRRAEELAALLSQELAGVSVDATDRPRSAVRGKDIVCCATNSTVPLFEADDLSPRAHVNAIGAYRPTMHELPGDLLASSFVCVDQLDAVLAESGEIIDALSGGQLRPADLTELGAALSRPDLPTPGRTVFKTVGVAMQDWAIAALVAKRLPR